MRKFLSILLVLISTGALADGFGGKNLNTELIPWNMAVAKGLVPGHSIVIIRGHNPSQTSASGFVDIAENGDLTYMTTADQMIVASTSGSDASAGVGLRTVLVSGVDVNGTMTSESITMNGTTGVTTDNLYYRVNSITGLTAGSTGWNVGAVTATGNTTGGVQSEMDATESISQNSHYTVPAGHTFYLLRVEFNAAKDGGGTNPQIEFKGYFRVGGDGAAWVQGFDKKLDTAVTDELDVDLPLPTALAEKTDIRLRSDTDKNATEVRTRLYGVLVAD